MFVYYAVISCFFLGYVRETLQLDHDSHYYFVFNVYFFILMLLLHLVPMGWPLLTLDTQTIAVLSNVRLVKNPTKQNPMLDIGVTGFFCWARQELIQLG